MNLLEKDAEEWATSTFDKYIETHQIQTFESWVSYLLDEIYSIGQLIDIDMEDPVLMKIRVIGMALGSKLNLKGELK